MYSQKFATRIRTLRRRLGWTRSDMARHLQCRCEEVEGWESDSFIPSQNHLSLLALLENRAESCSLGTLKSSRADRYLKDQRMDQIEASFLLQELV